LSKELSIKEVENLGYYDFMGYLGVPFFNIGGRGSIDRLAEVCHISAGSRVLEVGCGTGGNACYLAEKYGCIVDGIDIAENMVKQATARAEEMRLTDRASFKVGDAYHLDFPDRSFDVVVTVFVSQFLDPARAYPEFNRVLAVGGYLGINELYRADDIPLEAAARVDSSLRDFCELTQLPFMLRSPWTWRGTFEDAGFTGVITEEHPNSQEKPYSRGVIGAFGGWGGFTATLWKTLVYGLRSGKMRKKYVTINRVKKTLIRDGDTSRYIGYIICAGRKPA
jgi:ubiquinone/menaquinone biosynthesis C-methylase UbiE